LAIGAPHHRRGHPAPRRTRRPGGDFGGHNLRSGFITEGAHQGLALPALMANTDHRSVASAAGYFQQGGAQHNPAARLLDAD